MATFPSYVPTGRRFTPGTYPQKSYRSLSGAVVKRMYGNSPYGASLELTFDNIPDATAAVIINHYRNETALNRRFKVDATTMGGVGSTLLGLADGSTDNLRWEYSKPPEVQSVRPGISSLAVMLVGEIRNPVLDD